MELSSFGITQTPSSFLPLEQPPCSPGSFRDLTRGIVGFHWPACWQRSQFAVLSLGDVLKSRDLLKSWTICPFMLNSLTFSAPQVQKDSPHPFLGCISVDANHLSTFWKIKYFLGSATILRTFRSSERLGP